MKCHLNNGFRIPLVLSLLCAAGCATHVQPNWAAFALTDSSHIDDVKLIKKKLQVQKISCMGGNNSGMGMALIFVDSKDFTRATMIATNIISRNNLSVGIYTDTNENGFEVWTNGKTVGKENF